MIDMARRQGSGQASGQASGQTSGRAPGRGTTPRGRALLDASRRQEAAPASPLRQPAVETPACAVDWAGIDELYAFARTRGDQRAVEAESTHDRETAGLERLGLHVMRTLYRQARQQPEGGVLVDCAVSYFRARAMRDAHHPDFNGRWLGPPTVA